MVAAILPETETQLKPAQIDGPDRRAGMVIRVGLDGIRSVEIMAVDSAEEDKLRVQLMASRPVLELLHSAMRADR